MIVVILSEAKDLLARIVNRQKILPLRCAQGQDDRRVALVCKHGLVAAITLVLALLASTAHAQTRVPDAAQFVGAPKGAPVAGAELERRTVEVAGLLRCPVCQGLSVADSPSLMATNMKQQVRELLARGYTEEQILSYFEQSYGGFVLLKPKFRGPGILVWLLPLFVLLLGALIVYTKSRKLAGPPNPPPPDDPYLDRVRELTGK
jgi:cytochrome c-type biogenesis protein CcmH